MGTMIIGTNVILQEQKAEDAKFFAYWFNQPQIMFQCGFRQEGIQEQGYFYNNEYSDFIMMRILRAEWKYNNML